MANKIILLCLVCVILTLCHETFAGRFGGSRSSGSRSSSSSSRSSSSGSRSYSSGGSKYSGGSSYHSSYSKPSRTSSSSHGYPISSGFSGSKSKSISSGLPKSIFGSTLSAYDKIKPSRSSLSGNKKPSPSYPPSPGLSGFRGSPSSPPKSSGSGNLYPPAKSGLSGDKKLSVSYPVSKGLSGFNGAPTSKPSGSPGFSVPTLTKPVSTYPQSKTGLSGLSNTHLTTHYSPGFSGPSHTHSTHHTEYVPSYLPSYYNSPQHVYVTEYRNSNSRYSDLLTGLALYNLGRSHSNHHDHYYYDDYYRRRYDSNFGQTTQNKPAESAVCVLKIKENDRIESLKVPCEIVSTFTQDADKRNVTTQTVCTTNVTVVNNTGNATVASNMTTVNTTSCTTNTTDPLNVKGPKISPTNSECSVEILTNNTVYNKKVDCNVLMSYSKLPEPKKEERGLLMPSRETLKSWSEKPPWWMSILIAA